MSQPTYRIEKDSMGEVRVPADALYAAQTQRAVDNFPISDLRFPRIFIRALGMIKGAAAAVNLDLGLMTPEMAAAIQSAAQEVARRAARRPIPPGHLPDRLRHQHQHERQRSAGHPGHPEVGQQSPSQRPRQHGPEQQRRHPHGHPPERLSGHGGDSAARPAISQGWPGRQGRRGGPCGHHRAHPLDGCHARAPEPGIGRLGQPDRPRHGPAQRQPAPHRRVGPGRHGRGHGHQRPSRNLPTASPPNWPSGPGCPWSSRATSSRAWPPRTPPWN